MNIKKILKWIGIGLLILLVLVCIIYTGLGIYQNSATGFRNKWAGFGYSEAIRQIFEPASQCQQVPITYNNQTINLIATGCLE